MKELVMQGLAVLVQLVVLAVAGFSINFLRVKTGNEKFSKLLGYAKMAVASVEQSMGPGSGTEKKKAVEDFIFSKLGGKLSLPEINHLIESAVYEMKQVFNSTNASAPAPNITQPEISQAPTEQVIDTDKVDAAVNNAKSESIPEARSEIPEQEVNLINNTEGDTK